MREFRISPLLFGLLLICGSVLVVTSVRAEDVEAPKGAIVKVTSHLSYKICSLVWGAEYKAGDPKTFRYKVRVGDLKPGESREIRGGSSGAREVPDAWHLHADSCDIGNANVLYAKTKKVHDKKFEVVLYEGEKPKAKTSKSATLYVDMADPRNSNGGVLEIVNESRTPICALKNIGEDGRIQADRFAAGGLKKEKMGKGDRLLFRLTSKQNYNIRLTKCNHKQWMYVGKIAVKGGLQLVVTDKGKTKTKAREGFEQKVVKTKTINCPRVQWTVTAAAEHCRNIIDTRSREKCEHRTSKKRNFGKKAPHCGHL